MWTNGLAIVPLRTLGCGTPAFERFDESGQLYSQALEALREQPGRRIGIVGSGPDSER